MDDKVFYFIISVLLLGILGGIIFLYNAETKRSMREIRLSMDKQIDKFETRVEAFNSKLTKLEDKMNEFNDTMRQYDAKFDSFDSVVNSIDSLDRKVSKIGPTTDYKISSKLNSIYNRLKKIETEIFQ